MRRLVYVWKRDKGRGGALPREGLSCFLFAAESPFFPFLAYVQAERDRFEADARTTILMEAFGPRLKKGQGGGEGIPRESVSSLIGTEPPLFPFLACVHSECDISALDASVEPLFLRNAWSTFGELFGVGEAEGAGVPRASSLHTSSE